MQKTLRPSSVIPTEFAIVSASIADDRATIVVRSTSPSRECPKNGGVSGSVHSRYRSQILDPPLAGPPREIDRGCPPLSLRNPDQRAECDRGKENANNIHQPIRAAA